MARYSRMQTLTAMYEQGLVLVFYHPNAALACDVVQACAEGGARLIEFTNRGDAAFNIYARVEERCAQHLPQVITGAGSIVDEGSAALFMNIGANFVVGPTLNPAIATVCNRRKIPYSPGCGTASEVSQAEALGCEIVKIFPGGQVGGPGFVKALRAPCPWTSLMPTGGVEPNEASLREWFSAGIACAGIGSQLLSAELIEKHDFKGITQRVRTTLEIISQIRTS